MSLIFFFFQKKLMVCVMHKQKFTDVLKRFYQRIHFTWVFFPQILLPSDHYGKDIYSGKSVHRTVLCIGSLLLCRWYLFSMCQINHVPTLRAQSTVLSDIVLSASIIITHPAQIDLNNYSCHLQVVTICQNPKETFQAHSV